MFCALMLLVLASAQRAAAQDKFTVSLLKCDRETGEITNDHSVKLHGVCGNCIDLGPQVLLFSCEDANKVTVYDSVSGCAAREPGLDVDLSSRKCLYLGANFGLRSIEVARAGSAVPTTTTAKRALEDAPSVPTATSGAATSSARALPAATALSAAAAVRAALRL